MFAWLAPLFLSGVSVRIFMLNLLSGLSVFVCVLNLCLLDLDLDLDLPRLLVCFMFGPLHSPTCWSSAFSVLHACGTAVSKVQALSTTGPIRPLIEGVDTCLALCVRCSVQGNL